MVPAAASRRRRRRRAMPRRTRQQPSGHGEECDPVADRVPSAQADDKRLRARRRLRQAMHEFAAVPLAVIALFLLLATLSILIDQSHVSALEAVRRAFEHLVGKQAAVQTLQSIAAGLVTVTSITFSVLLLAVQQTASTLSPVVFDQFMRRRTNQIFFGFFLGLSLYSYVVLLAVQNDTPPVLGATLATLLTVVALASLLLLVYSTLDQMRPASVLRQIHDRTLHGRRHEADIIRRTRRRELSSRPVTATYHARTMGYVVGIDLRRLAGALQQVPEAEIRLWVPLGQAVAFGDRIATVRDDDPEAAKRLADEIRGAVLIAAEPDPDVDATTGMDQIGNIAWTSASTAKQNPEVARRAIHVLRDLVARWLDEPDITDDAERSAIVYPDDDLDHALDTLYAILGAAHESQQHATAADVVQAYRRLLDRADGAVATRIRADLDTGGQLLEEIPPAPVLQAVLRRLRDDGLQPSR
ncbi:DUF2254 family protein [Actinoplanes sp. NPDC026623]|uniref:DUF2254 family protein n=1 Tax=Actinoplanes sp. NPDC026623 TaxID=3155610 RepID=UPI0033E9488B